MIECTRTQNSISACKMCSLIRHSSLLPRVVLEVRVPCRRLFLISPSMTFVFRTPCTQVTQPRRHFKHTLQARPGVGGPLNLAGAMVGGPGAGQVLRGPNNLMPGGAPNPSIVPGMAHLGGGGPQISSQANPMAPFNTISLLQQQQQQNNFANANNAQARQMQQQQQQMAASLNLNATAAGLAQQQQRMAAGLGPGGLGLGMQPAAAGAGGGGQGGLNNIQPSQDLLTLLSKQQLPRQQQQQQQGLQYNNAALAYNTAAQQQQTGVPLTVQQQQLQLQQQNQQQQQQLHQQQLAAAQQQQQQNQNQQEQDGPAFDTSDFPSLGGGPTASRLPLTRPTLLGQDTHQGPTASDMLSALGVRKGGMTIAGGGGMDGFSMQKEDFPALPGSALPMADDMRGSVGGRSGNLSLGGSALTAGGGETIEVSGMRTGLGGDYDPQMLRYHQQQQQQGAAARLAATAAGASGSSALPGGVGGLRAAMLGGGPEAAAAGGTGQPASGSAAGLGAGSSSPDRFGLLGLLPLIKMTDQDLTMLALGTDLTSLGLNLNSVENLHKTFVSPLADSPIKPEPSFELPACYSFVPQRLQPGYLGKFKDETLFYM